MSVFKRRRFPAKIILLCVRWYCRYGISYRDLAEMMAEHGVAGLREGQICGRFGLFVILMTRYERALLH